MVGGGGNNGVLGSGRERFQGRRTRLVFSFSKLSDASPNQIHPATFVSESEGGRYKADGEFGIVYMEMRNSKK